MTRSTRAAVSTNAHPMKAGHNPMVSSTCRSFGKSLSFQKSCLSKASKPPRIRGLPPFATWNLRRLWKCWNFLWWWSMFNLLRGRIRCSSACHDLHSTFSCGRIHFSSSSRTRSTSTCGRVCGTLSCDRVHDTIAARASRPGCAGFSGAKSLSLGCACSAQDTQTSESLGTAPIRQNEACGEHGSGGVQAVPLCRTCSSDACDDTRGRRASCCGGPRAT